MRSTCSSSSLLRSSLSGSATPVTLIRIAGSLKAGEQILGKDQARGGAKEKKAKKSFSKTLSTAFCSIQGEKTQLQAAESLRSDQILPGHRRIDNRLVVA